MVEESWKEDEHQKNSLKSSYSAMLSVMLHHLHCYELPAKPNQYHAAHFLPQSNKECIINSHAVNPACNTNKRLALHVDDEHKQVKKKHPRAAMHYEECETKAHHGHNLIYRGDNLLQET